MSLSGFGVLCRHCVVAGIVALSLITLAVMAWIFLI